MPLRPVNKALLEKCVGLSVKLKNMGLSENSSPLVSQAGCGPDSPAGSFWHSAPGVF